MKYTIRFENNDGKKRQLSTNDREHAKEVREATHGTLFVNHEYGSVKL